VKRILQQSSVSYFRNGHLKFRHWENVFSLTFPIWQSEDSERKRERPLYVLLCSINLWKFQQYKVRSVLSTWANLKRNMFPKCVISYTHCICRLTYRVSCWKLMGSLNSEAMHCSIQIVMNILLFLSSYWGPQRIVAVLRADSPGKPAQWFAESIPESWGVSFVICHLSFVCFECE
jgi:hypothetical protein